MPRSAGLLSGSALSYDHRIGKNILEMSAGGLEMKEATLYTAFRRLESAGLIRSYWGEGTSGARRRYYTLTEAGAQRLCADRQNWAVTRETLDILLGGNNDER